MNILVAFLALVLALMLTACGVGGDRVERFAEAAPGNGENIAIPGYEKLSFAAGKTFDAPLRLLFPARQHPTQRSGWSTIVITVEE